MVTVIINRRPGLCGQHNITLKQPQRHARENILATKASSTELHVDTEKAKLLKHNAEVIRPITMNHLPVKEIKEFTCLGSTVAEDGDGSRRWRR